MPRFFHVLVYHVLVRLLGAGVLTLAGPCAVADTVTVTLTGIKGKLEDNVRKFLSIAEDSEEPLTAAQIKRRHRSAPSEIRSALQPFGYYQPKINTELEKNGKAWQARYAIERGPATTISALELRVTGPGQDEARLAKVLERSELAEGERLIHAHYTATKTALRQTAYDAGYLDVAYETATIRVFPEASRAEVSLVLDTGPRYYFGDIRIEQDILAEDFVRRYLTFERGDRFDTDLLTDLQLALSNTGYFSQVEIEAAREAIVTQGDSEHYPQLPVVVRGTPSKPQRYSVSAGFGTDTGPRISLGVELRHLNRRGHKLQSNLRVSTIKQELNARYIAPVDDVRHDQVAFGTALTREQYGDLTSNIARLSGARVDGRKYGSQRLYLNLERERFDDGDGSGKRTSSLLYPGATFTYQWADDPLRTRRGVSLSLDLHGGLEAVVSETDFAQATLSGASVLPLSANVRFLMRGQLGTTEVGNFAALPPSQRFFTGGGRNVRGYGFREISPENADGDDIGGRYLAEASIEAEYLFYGNFGAAAFFDVGDAAMDVGDVNLRRGVGIGARWLSPIGSVRLDFAHPLDDPNSDFRVHFTLGPDL